MAPADGCGNGERGLVGAGDEVFDVVGVGAWEVGVEGWEGC